LLHDFLGRHESYILFLDRARDTARLDYTEPDGERKAIEVSRVGVEEGEEIFLVRVLTVDESENEVEELREEAPFSIAARIIRNVLRPPLQELLEKL
jgi:hypothetical protein